MASKRKVSTAEAASNGRRASRRNIRASLADAEDTPATVDVEHNSNDRPIGRMEQMAEIARRRAAHFAHFNVENEEENQGNNVHVGGDQAASLGPWSSARQLVSARAAAAEARKERLLGTADSDQDEVVRWEPSRLNWEHKRRLCKHKVPPLSRLCVATVADHIEDVESLCGLPQTYMTQIAECVAGRRLTVDAWHVFTANAPSEVVMLNCTQLSEADLITGLKSSCTYRLERLELHCCGRSLGDKAAAAIAAAGPLNALLRLHLSGAYRLRPPALLSVLASAPALEELHVPQCIALQGDEVPRLARLLSNLRLLDLWGCAGLAAKPLAAGLRAMDGLEWISLSEVGSVDDNVLAAMARPGLRGVHVARCNKITDAGIAALAASAPLLRELNVSETPLSEEAFAAVALRCPALSLLTARKCPRLKSEAPLLAIAQNGMLQRVDVSVNRVVTGRLLVELAASCARSLRDLDISFCRGVQGRAVGHLLDACACLETLRVYGCSQLPQSALHGHSNSIVRIEGEPTYQATVTESMVAVVGTCTAADNEDAPVVGATGTGQSPSETASSDSESMEVI